MDETTYRWLEQKKRRLIDTGRRNRLLYFKAASPSSPAPSVLRLMQPAPGELCRRLVVQGRTLSFYLPEVQKVPVEDADVEAPPAWDPGPGDLVTDIWPTELDRLRRSLYALRRKSRSSLQEQGLVTLFVSFGLLNWTDTKGAGDLCQSPLLLAPVELLQETPRSPYRLRLFEEDPVVNPTLAYKLETDFGLQLPKLPEVDELDLDAYLAAVEMAVQSFRSWSVACETYLGLFSFQKIALYRDLEAYAERAASHPIIRALAGDPSCLPSLPTDLPTGAELDRVVVPAETFQVLDADSSQQEAIQAAKRGVSFVLQGPPGTGKSQTIANIIAECLALGKKVLFVSEKMAALEVVYRRLSQSGLGEFCLEAHSHKAHKKDVVEALGRSLDAVPTGWAEGEADLAELARLRERLNEVVTLLHMPRASLGRSAHQVQAELAGYGDAPDLTFYYEQPLGVTAARLSEIDALLDELLLYPEIIVNHSGHPWRGVRVEQVTLQLQGEIRQRFTGLATAVADVVRVSRDLAHLCGVGEPKDLPAVERLNELAGLLAVSPSPPAEWFHRESLTPLTQAAEEYRGRFAAYRARRGTLLQQHAEAVFTVDHSTLVERLTVRPQPLLQQVCGGSERPEDRLVREREGILPALARLSDSLQRLQGNAPALAAASGVAAPTSLAEVTHLLEVGRLVARDPQPEPSWLERARLVELQSAAEAARDATGAVGTAEGELGPRYTEEFLSLDHAPLIERFAGPYASVLRFLRPGYYREMRLVRGQLRAAGALTPQQALADLKTARLLVEKRRWLEEKRSSHAADFGRHFDGRNTSWPGVVEALGTCRDIVNRLGGTVPDGLQRVLVSSGPAVAAVQRRLTTVETEASSATESLATLGETFSLISMPPDGVPAEEMEMGALREWVERTRGVLADLLAAYDTVRQTRLHPDAETPEVASLVAALREAKDVVEVERAVQAESARLAEQFGPLFRGLTTQWEDVLAALGWTGQVQRWFAGEPVPPAFVDVATGPSSGAAAAGEHRQALLSLRGQVADELAFVERLFEADAATVEGQALEKAPLIALVDWAQVRANRVTDLQRWLDFARLRDQAARLGLMSFVASILLQPPPVETLKAGFYKRFWTLWLDALYQADPALGSFSGDRHETAISRFARLDREHLRLAQSRLRGRLLSRRPKQGWGQVGEAGILRGEVRKKRRHMPLRTLFRSIPTLLPALKPCLLMSPLSVAEFLHPEGIRFDVVVFDEASQIRSEDVLGAIMRGDQLIVVGDNKQLPPTDFFTKTTEADGDEYHQEDVGAADYESVLDECATRALPQQMLRWHYRSRCERLIAFSNHHYYDDSLLTFPGACVESGATTACIEFIYVPDGVYLSGKVTGAGTNRIEAQRAAHLVLEHAANNPHQTLGVIAFSEAQQTAIDEEVRRLRLARPECEKFFTEAGTEPFFVKNLETVQGDERDVIIFSIGYGRDQNGKVSMRFGPLARTGGERRLNVAVTRARDRVKLVSSLQAQDIDLARTSARGSALLKSYLQYAADGSGARSGADGERPPFPEDALEEVVAQALERNELLVDRRVGATDCRVDLAVADPSDPTRYLLGIQLDGPDYARTPTARDRDRLRAEVLQALGWRVHRLWAADWVRDPEGQLARILAAVEAARSSPLAAPAPLLDRVPAPETPTGPELTATLVPEPYQPRLDLSVASDHAPGMSQPGTCGPSAATADGGLPDGVTVYRAAHPLRQGPPEEFYRLADMKAGRITDVLIRVVREEGPLHLTVATRRVVAEWQMSRAGSKLVETIREAARRAEKRGAIHIRGEFLWPAGMQQPPVRVPAPGEPARAVGEIPLEEIAAAARLCVQTACGISREELIVETARLLGYQRTGSEVRARIEEGVELLLTQDGIEEVKGTIALA